MRVKSVVGMGAGLGAALFIIFLGWPRISVQMEPRTAQAQSSPASELEQVDFLWIQDGKDDQAVSDGILKGWPARPLHPWVKGMKQGCCFCVGTLPDPAAPWGNMQRFAGRSAIDMGCTWANNLGPDARIGFDIEVGSDGVNNEDLLVARVRKTFAEARIYTGLPLANYETPATRAHKTQNLASLCGRLWIRVYWSPKQMSGQTWLNEIVKPKFEEIAKLCPDRPICAGVNIFDDVGGAPLSQDQIGFMIDSIAGLSLPGNKKVSACWWWGWDHQKWIDRSNPYAFPWVAELAKRYGKTS